jgi:cation diffusion facilitator CzcD-associated flavoprotein CzcO
MRADYDTIILGAGFGGLGLAILLKEAGRDDFCILEKAARVGGTWRDDTYPGACCDVPSHLYCYGFAPKRDWSRVFAPQPEILGYIDDLVAAHDLGS